MKTLHLLRSPADDIVRTLMAPFSSAGENVEVSLSEERVDYDRLVALIFECDRVICWW